jgi:hypothetical protein
MMGLGSRVVVGALCAGGIACSGGKRSSCELAVHHVMQTLASAAPAGSQPKADEQAVIDQVEAQSVVQCTKEGLSDAQLACILAIKTSRDLAASSDCAAIKAKHPGWLLTPP